MDGSSIQQIEYEHMLLGRYSVHGLTPQNGGFSLERSHLVLLSRLSVGGPMSVGELSEAFGLDVSTVHRQVTAAQRAGLVERIPDPGGGVARKYRPTESGERSLVADRAARVDGFTALLDDWPEADRVAFGTYLRRFNESVEERRGLSWPRD